MTDKNKKQFGVWMDSRDAIVAGRSSTGDGAFTILGHIQNAGADNNSNENAFNHQEISLTKKFFKEIAASMINIDEIHVTGTGQIQEEFIKFLKNTPQYKNALTSDSTANKMTDEQLVIFFNQHFN